MPRLLGIAILTLTACGSDTRPDFECIANQSCDLDDRNGECRTACSGRKWCAYPEEVMQCPSGERWSDFETGDGLSGKCVEDSDFCEDSDAGPDAQADATPLSKSLDVGFVNQFRIGTPVSGNFQVFDWIRLANTGEAELDLSNAVVSVVFDDDRHIANVEWFGPVTPSLRLLPGRSAGRLSPSASELIVNSGLINEPAQDIAQGYLALRVPESPEPGTWLTLNLEVTIEVEDLRVTLPTAIVLSGANNTVTPFAASRVSSTPIE